MDERKLSSLIDEQSMASRVLAEMGVFSMPIADDMWSLAITQPGIADARLDIDGLYGEGDLGLIFYLKPKSWILYLFQRFFEKRQGILGKIGLLLLKRWGAPVNAAQQLANQARTILPNYYVRVEFRRKVRSV